MCRPSGEYRNLFPQKHIPIILILILQAGKSLRKKTETDREDWLTTRLHRQLIRLPIFRDGPLQINLQPDIVYSDADTEKNTPEGRLDLQVTCGIGYETYFAIEAKRLRVPLPSGFFKGSWEYISEGMMRFVKGQYAPHMQAGAMLGYVFDGQKEKARSDINEAVISKAKDLKLKKPHRLATTSILPDQSIDETQHDLKKRYFTIYHLFLNV